MAELTKYAVARDWYFVVVKRAVVDFAVSADWTPAAGDCKISIDGGATANVTNLPTAIAMGNTAIWKWTATSGEMTGKQMVMTIADAATKAVEDQSLRIETFGNASAQHPFDLDTATVVASSVTAVSSGAITNASFASAAIDAAAIATDAIGSAELATSAVNEIRDAIIALLTGRTGTAQAGAAGTITLDSGASAVDDFYKGHAVLITGGTGLGQTRLVHSYVGSTKVATVGDNWATNPDATSVFTLIPSRVYMTLAKTDSINAAALATDAVTELQTGLATSAGQATLATAASIAALPTDASIRDSVWGKSMSELSAVPAPTDSVLAGLEWLLAVARNLRAQNGTAETIYKDDGVSVLGTSTKTNDGTTFNRGKYT